MEIKTSVEHFEKLTAFLDRHALEKMVADAVAKKAGLSLTRRNVSAKVEIREVTEGSPAYRVGYSAFVTIIVDHAAQNTPEAASS